MAAGTALRVDIGALVAAVLALVLQVWQQGETAFVLVSISACGTVLGVQVWCRRSAGQTAHPIVTVCWAGVTSVAVGAGCATGDWPRSPDGDVLGWASVTSGVLVAALVLHHGDRVTTVLHGWSGLPHAGLVPTMAVLIVVAFSALTLALDETAHGAIRILTTVGMREAVVVVEDPPVQEGWLPCTHDIGAVADPDDAPLVSAAERIRIEAEEHEDYALCGVGPVVEIHPGHFAQAVNSTEPAGPTGWFSVRHDAEGVPETQLIEPQVGQVLLKQTDPEWVSGAPPWTATYGEAGRVVACDGGGLRVFWKHGRVSAFVWQTYIPTGPEDTRTMQAWFVPAPVARALLDDHSAPGLPFPRAAGAPDADGAQEFEDIGEVDPVPGDDVIVGAQELLDLCE